MKIHRYVKMTFRPEEVGQFLEVFNASKEKIRNFPGCLSLQLISNIEEPNILCTSSIWRDADCLENYRNSELFAETWKKTKILFAEKAKAQSYNLIDWLS